MTTSLAGWPSLRDHYILYTHTSYVQGVQKSGCIKIKLKPVPNLLKIWFLREKPAKNCSRPGFAGLGFEKT
jgi:hypothetical protein